MHELHTFLLFSEAVHCAVSVFHPVSVLDGCASCGLVYWVHLPDPHLLFKISNKRERITIGSVFKLRSRAFTIHVVLFPDRVVLSAMISTSRAEIISRIELIGPRSSCSGMDGSGGSVDLVDIQVGVKKFKVFRYQLIFLL